MSFSGELGKQILVEIAHYMYLKGLVTPALNDISEENEFAFAQSSIMTNIFFFAIDQL